MLDIKLWSKLYWENDLNHWKNIANELKNKEPYEYAMEVSNRIQIINNNYFKECSEESPGYYPSVEMDKKFKKLKKNLGDKSKQISIKDWVNEINKVEEKAILFFYYFAKQTGMKEKGQISVQLNSYNEKIIDFLKNEFIKAEKPNLKNLDNELQSILSQQTNKNSQFIIKFYEEEKNEIWFKDNLNEISCFKTFIYYNIHLIEETNEDLLMWSNYLNKNTNNQQLIQLNSILLSNLELFEKEDRINNFSKSLPIDYWDAYKSLIFSEINVFSILEKWYDLVLREEKNEKLFFDEIWFHEEKDNKITATLSNESILLDFIANKMSVVYTKEELEKFNFTNSIISNENLQQIMSKKISYYYLENKLSANNKKVKSKKI